MSISSNGKTINSGRDSGLDGVLSKAESDFSKDKVFSGTEYPYTVSDESEVSVQSLLDQSEFSLLTSSPEAGIPIGCSVSFNNQTNLSSLARVKIVEVMYRMFQRPRGRNHFTKSFIGKSIDEKFNSLLNVVMKHGDEINALYRENSRGRRNSQTDPKNSIQGWVRIPILKWTGWELLLLYYLYSLILSENFFYYVFKLFLRFLLLAGVNFGPLTHFRNKIGDHVTYIPPFNIFWTLEKIEKHFVSW